MAPVRSKRFPRHVNSLSTHARTQVAGWLGISAEKALEETGAAAEELFEKPRPNL
jgi:hypothetical protein